MAHENHWRAKEALKMKDAKMTTFCRRVMKGRHRTLFLDEVRQRTIVMRLKGEL